MPCGWGSTARSAPPEKQFLLDDSGTSLLLCDAPTAEQVSGGGVGAGVECYGRGRTGEWQDALAAAPDDPFVSDVDPYAPAGIAYTSGTTGYPKGATHSQHNLLVPGAMLGASRGWGPSLRKGDFLALTILNMQVLTTLISAQAGGSVIIGPHRRGRRRRVDPRRAGDGVERAAGGHPLDRAGRRGPADDLASLDEVWIGGGDCPESVRAAFQQKFGMPLLTTYGLSEAPTVVTTDDLDGGHVVGASGRPLPHLDMQIVDDEVCVGP